MKVQALFSNGDASCRLKITTPTGHLQHVLFENVSSMVNFCNKEGIDVMVGNCMVED